MFLKQDTFNYEKQSVVLSELSGLQRIEYLTFVQQRTAKFDAGEGELPEAERQIAFLRMGMDINAWLVSRSLWNAEQSQDVERFTHPLLQHGRMMPWVRGRRWFCR
ncbi:minor tail component of prophage [Escherichia coli]|nr:minor tail component of prophage [Escherichia coli]